MTITFAPAANSEVRDGVEVRPEDIRVTKDFISECVDAVQDDPDVSCCNPFLKDGAVVEVIGAWPALEGTEGDAGTGQRRNVTEVVATNRLRLVVT
jgi:hypothetical protein